MATNTTKLGLIKPAYVDVVDVADLNANADDIDAAVGFVICTSTTRPSTPWLGQSIFETNTGESYVWDGSAWQPAGGGGSIDISATAPVSPSAGDLWWDSDNGNLYIYYDDGSGAQWVAANGPQVFVGTAAPSGYQGQLWFDSTQGKTYIYYDDGTSAQWVSAIGGSLAGNVIQVVSTTKTDAFSASVTTGNYVAVTGLSATITPRSTSSKILVRATVTGSATTASNGGIVDIRLKRGSTAIGIADAACNRPRLSSGTYAAVGVGESKATVSAEFLDSPNTTSSTTYSVDLYNLSSTTQTLYCNRTHTDTDGVSWARMVSTITVMEIAG